MPDESAPFVAIAEPLSGDSATGSGGFASATVSGSINAKSALAETELLSASCAVDKVENPPIAMRRQATRKNEVKRSIGKAGWR